MGPAQLPGPLLGHAQGAEAEGRPARHAAWLLLTLRAAGWFLVGCCCHPRRWSVEHMGCAQGLGRCHVLGRNDHRRRHDCDEVQLCTGRILHPGQEFIAVRDLGGVGEVLRGQLQGGYHLPGCALQEQEGAPISLPILVAELPAQQMPSLRRPEQLTEAQRLGDGHPLPRGEVMNLPELIHISTRSPSNTLKNVFIIPKEFVIGTIGE